MKEYVGQITIDGFVLIFIHYGPIFWSQKWESSLGNLGNLLLKQIDKLLKKKKPCFLLLYCTI